MIRIYGFFASHKVLLLHWGNLIKHRYIPSMPPRRFFGAIQRETCLEGDHIFFSEEDPMSCSNFVDLDWLSSSGNPCEEVPFERSLGFNSPNARDSSENVVTGESTPSLSEYVSSMMLPPQEDRLASGWDVRFVLCWSSSSPFVFSN
uniref:Uncharacterized protein n=1 Tax=Cucumis sativus TaxID=3659 RepID=A0A0A0KUM4_CUCSA